MAASRTKSQKLTTIEEKFRAFHEAHPNIHRQLFRVARTRAISSRTAQAGRPQMTGTATPTCTCDGTGWIDSPNGGVVRCPCKRPKPPTEPKPEGNGIELPEQTGLEFALTQYEESWKFHQANPHIYDRLLQAALE